MRFQLLAQGGAVDQARGQFQLAGGGGQFGPWRPGSRRPCRGWTRDSPAPTRLSRRPRRYGLTEVSPQAIGATPCASPAVRKLSFTGSTAVGQRLYAQCAGSVKKLSLELGGNAPFIVFDDADLEAAVQGLMPSKFRNSGQTCLCANRIYVQDALQRGATLRLGGAPLRQGDLAGGHFFAPTVLTKVPADVRVAREETFGPLAAIVRFHTEDEVIALANDSPYGLAAYFYSRDIGRVHRVNEALESGMVGVNTGLISTEVAKYTAKAC
ncbi:aldehyde dehydrogenase family protein [Ideonella sp. TBM-1]|uniref:Aldehyde dehydrogenase family protein n=1 Tax=Ideonella livida TaxID=2707176 RepID=A0A7C9PKN0_9BURK|nr:aldehyde dehydrogenase family protein [Ideonella livida]